MSGSAYLHWLSDKLVPADKPSTNPAPARADTVIGFAAGYSVDDVAPFIRSLRSVFSGRVILIVDRNPTLQAYLRIKRVEIETITRRPFRWRPHPVVERFAAYARVLASRDDIGKVVITDVRDVVFQGDPFGKVQDELQFFLEADGRSLGDHALNLKHLRRLAGDGFTGALSGRPCVCVDVVAGPSEAVTRFCRTLMLLSAIPRSRLGGAFRADLAACNLIAHLDLAGGRICANFGRVATVGLTPPGQLSVVDGRIQNPDGSVSPIVHHYDRIERLADHVAERWGTSEKMHRRRAPMRARASSRPPGLDTVGLLKQDRPQADGG